MIASITRYGSAYPPINNPKKIATSAILSNIESRYDPFFEVFPVILATCPSTISKNPDTSNKTPPIINPNSIPIPYTTADARANTRPTNVQKLGESPVDANAFPIFSSIGCNVPLRLFNIVNFPIVFST